VHRHAELGMGMLDNFYSKHEHSSMFSPPYSNKRMKNMATKGGKGASSEDQSSNYSKWFSSPTLLKSHKDFNSLLRWKNKVQLDSGFIFT
ncbi:hypothetical protein CR513_44081, partial [Mucuna pruriens]